MLIHGDGGHFARKPGFRFVSDLKIDPSCAEHHDSAGATPVVLVLASCDQGEVWWAAMVPTCPLRLELISIPLWIQERTATHELLFHSGVRMLAADDG